ncbi:nodal homolog 2-A-like [Hyla sarda]|uniref:nodal homolog 2-A-like n=1 Tax=Hyla sarda TaxID=327740 RepID=UPI0024C2300E|nr:nodal homolog 2-A-like [Hyla sarda]
MMQLYQSLIAGNATDLSGLEHPALQESDTVLSLSARSYTREGDRWMISFDMSSISSSTELKLVELRVRFPPFGKTHNITVEIYHSKEGQDKLFMGSFKTNPTTQEDDTWKIFNLTRILQNSIYQGQPDSHVEYIPPEDLVHGRATDSGQNPQHHTEHLTGAPFPLDRAILVVFARERPATKHYGSPSLIQTVQSSKYIMSERATIGSGLRRQRRNHNPKHNIIANNLQARAKEMGAPFCRRVDMWVEFDKIEWGNRIVYPRRYNAYRCEGTCPIPLSENFQPTNHAFIKSLVKLYDTEKVECSSCVPVKMSALSMLIYEEENVTLKHHEDMVVEECGCNLQEAMPKLLETEARIGLPGTNMGLKFSSFLFGKQHSLDVQYPQYMMQLYHTLTKNDTNLFNKQRPEIPDYDSVLSLVAKNCTMVNNRIMLYFDMSSIAAGNDLKLAQLRIHLPSFEISKNFTLEIYHSKGGYNLFLGSFKVDPSDMKESPWKSFDLTKIIQYFLHQVEKNMDEVMKTKVMKDRNKETNIHMESEPTTKDTPDRVYANLAERVVLVVFTKDKSVDSISGSPSLIKTVESSKHVTLDKTHRLPGIRRHRRNRNENHHLFMNHAPSKPIESGKPLCRRVDMIIDFSKIEMGSWIIYPKKYNAYRCEGACPIPLNETFKPTNHAYMKSMLKLYQPERVECPSCVPIRMSPLSMLYYEGNDVVVRNHEEMIVEECGCS